MTAFAVATSSHRKTIGRDATTGTAASATSSHGPWDQVWSLSSFEVSCQLFNEWFDSSLVRLSSS